MRLVAQRKKKGRERERPQIYEKKRTERGNDDRRMEKERIKIEKNPIIRLMDIKLKRSFGAFSCRLLEKTFFPVSLPFLPFHLLSPSCHYIPEQCNKGMPKGEIVFTAYSARGASRNVARRQIWFVCRRVGRYYFGLKRERSASRVAMKDQYSKSG